MILFDLNLSAISVNVSEQPKKEENKLISQSLPIRIVFFYIKNLNK